MESSNPILLGWDLVQIRFDGTLPIRPNFFKKKINILLHILEIEILSVLNYATFVAHNAQCLYLRIKICMIEMLNS